MGETFRERLRRGMGWLAGGVEESGGPVAAAPAVPLREILRRFWPHARPCRRWLIPLLLLAALGPAVETATIWMYKVLVDEVLVPARFGLLPWVILAYLGLTMLDGAISFLDGYLSEWVGGRFIVRLRTEIFRHLQGLPPDFFDRRKLGDTVSRVSEDVEEIEQLLLSGGVSAVTYAFQLVFFVGALFYLEWRLALVSLLVAPLFWLLARRFSRRIKRAAREERRKAGSIGAVAEESLSNIALVQAYNRQEHEVARFHRENEGSFAAQMVAARLSALFSPLVNLVELLGVMVVISFGAYLLSRGGLTVGGLLVFLVYLGMLYRPIRGIGGLANSFFSAAAAAERVMELLEARPAVRDGALKPGRLRGEVRFAGVSFRYPGARSHALRGVSFEARPGEVVALVGPSGAGKSTVARLLLRFYDPESGSITLDGNDLRELSLRALRENVAVLLQETLIFDGTVRENIAYGRPGATDEEIRQAARAADAHGFIERLPEGYDTVVGQKGRLLSGGQRQRIAMARAILRDAPVLVLDEPTTGLDAGAEERILRPLKRLMEGRTTIVISHNLLAVRDATRIVVLEGGRVVESGTHAELLERGGLYAGLYRRHRPGREVG
ncbi:putative ABC transporter ATP-binding protein [Rubrobacter xylanophilus DSM 9941]|uniref:ABC transporter ATP-binding protein n=1 Tax=Rubrobacter xylanophilus TaxID=49319 RepID=UPI001C643C17|nr:ABC transporter ATP-binding protein [Rubrobacter xylanophilus]QYJ16412.1 putative ABC transporter ATP-binding protein [Rubrobacter xylanophilus DSM 9941]